MGDNHRMEQFIFTEELVEIPTSVLRCGLNRIQGTQNSTQDPILSLSLHQ